MKIFHPYHRTANSKRTLNMRLVGISQDGEINFVGYATKLACYIEMPDDTKYIFHLYYTCSGIPHVYIYDATDNLPTIARIYANTTSPYHVDKLLKKLNIPPSSPAATIVYNHLFYRRCEYEP